MEGTDNHDQRIGQPGVVEQLLVETPWCGTRLARKARHIHYFDVHVGRLLNLEQGGQSIQGGIGNLEDPQVDRALGSRTRRCRQSRQRVEEGQETKLFSLC